MKNLLKFISLSMLLMNVFVSSLNAASFHKMTSTKHDYNGDGVADFALRHPPLSLWTILNSADGQLGSDITRVRFGLQPRDIPVPADYDGDGMTDIAIRRPSNGTWYILNSSGSNFNSAKGDGIQRIRFGLKRDDIPVPADYNGDGKADVAIYRPSNKTWYISLPDSDEGKFKIRKVRFGLQPGDIPVPADYDGDGLDDIAIRRPSNGIWYILNSSGNNLNSAKGDGIQRVRFGLKKEDIPVPADYDGDGIDDIAVRRPSDGVWYILNSSNTNFNSEQRDGIQRVRFGQENSDIPVPADYDGDGIADVAIRRNSSHMFYILYSSDRVAREVVFGEEATDVAVNTSVNNILSSLKKAVTLTVIPPNIIVIFTDDHGYADLGVQNQLSDVITPNIDNLANNGVRFTHGYVTAPQCTPSRAAMITGQYQQRFGVDENKFTPIPIGVETLGNRFQNLGYQTGMVGKWHLEVDGNSKEWGAINHPEMVPFNAGNVPLQERRQFFPDSRGYDDTFFGFNIRYWTNFNLRGEPKPASYTNYSMYRLDAITKAATSFIDKNWQKPFYLHVAHYGPHVPLSATDEYLSRFPGDMPERRRYALAMLSAIDDGVGQIVDTLEKYNLLDNTLIYFISDNGAPLGDDMTDAPLTQLGTWDGSMNVPLAGEKGMLTEAGIRVPYIVYWRGHLNSGTVVDKPVSSLDAAYTALKLAGEYDLSELDGVDLMSALNGETEYLDTRALYWRFYKQRAVREGRWKYLQAGIKREYLFDLENDSQESFNLIQMYPEVAKRLRQKYLSWSSNLKRSDAMAEIEIPFQRRYDAYLPFY
ncbi:sulfatase-like hydrolase/transferase [Neptunicella sp. SCSIO 80796]|uniref:sulfatase-like hydrolase/transferase n=1 Tax=Neptunicella plasticusilytica TaxID=3117012 RepID=UPI003A4DE58B